MASPKLSNLKIRVDHLLITVGGVIVLVAAVLTWRALRSPPERDPLDEGLEQFRAKKGNRQAARPPRFVRPYHASKPREHDDPGEGRFVPTPPPQEDPGALGPDEAIDSFQEVLGELEAALEDGRRLSAREEAELYNRATGSFTALSSWVDASDPTERALMDDAYLQMKSLMRELDIQPPVHDPEARPRL
ncbi:hypothetical protein ENSA5_35490 [Enhygromyxa salina]|uniref:Uncharacterized protein n=1 Tax=Enhygromyxa salina TaxID=215803 RepID=A0A2S9XV87_9BACT|nr:hypothetical protein [Enhygromyxa salina]PRP96775.1 hypothetical protein ENSA5_35490 [Enhygromyxa salina]